MIPDTSYNYALKRAYLNVRPQLKTGFPLWPFYEPAVKFDKPYTKECFQQSQI